MANARDAELHKGHRERLRERADKNGVQSMSKYEQVELLLFHAIGRRDLNELAHILINTFGSFNKIIDADKKDLLKIKGVGPKTATFLKTFRQFFEIYSNGKFSGKEKLETSTQCVEFFRENFKIDSKENAYMTLFNKNYEIIKTISIGKSNNAFDVELDLTCVKNELIDSSVKCAVLYHTHPFAVKPSIADLMVTTEILRDKEIGSKISDHIILNKKDFFSYKDSGVLNELKMIAQDRLIMLKVGDPKTYDNIIKNLEKDNDI